MSASFSNSFRYLLYYQLVGTVLNTLVQGIFLQLVSTEVLGLINVQLALIPNVVLTLTREPFRKTTPRFPGKENIPKLAHAGLLLFPMGIAISILQFFASRLSNPSWTSLPNFGIGFFLYTISSVLELTFEPYYTQVSSNYALRKDVDTKVLLIHSSLSLAAAYLYGRTPQKAVIAFGIVHFITSSYYFYRYRRAAPIRNVIGSWSAGLHVRTVFWTFFWDTLTRFFLAQGDVILLTSLAAPSTQGLFSVLSNYGGLVLRIVFAPLEDSIRSFYSAKANQDGGGIFEAVFVFAQWFSLALSIFGSQYAVPILGLLPLSGRLLEILPLVPPYCHLMSLMILNGLLEAYLHGSLPVTQLSKLKIHTVFITCIYFALAIYLLQNFPQSGIIYANLTNFGMRIILALWHLGFRVPTVDLFSLVLTLSSGAACYHFNLSLPKAVGLGLVSASTVIVRDRRRILSLKALLI